MNCRDDLMNSRAFKTGNIQAAEVSHSPVLVFATAILLPFLPSAQSAEIAEIGNLKAPEATQAAAADERFVFAVGSAEVARYDRSTGERQALSTGKAKHLNSGFLWNGKLYCAHSNFPLKPEQSQIMVLDVATMTLGVFKDFGEYRGSLTWAVHEGDFWWCTFAHYGADNAKTVLVKLDDQWKELGAWFYPPEVIQDLGKFSISGGVWRKNQLFATGHDHRVLFRLEIPEKGDVLRLVETIPSPFPGQGIANDPKTGGFIGINRAKRQVVFGELRE